MKPQVWGITETARFVTEPYIADCNLTLNVSSSSSSSIPAAPVKRFVSVQFLNPIHSQ
jgi:hypothetical protein